MEKNKFIKLFAYRDALLRSVSLSAGSFTVATISIIPGFGTNGLLIASIIQVILTAFLDFPTSLLADKKGRSKLLKLSLIFKIFVSLALFLSIIAAKNNNTTLVWVFFSLEALLDSIANSLLSGTYQMAYLTLYETKCKEDGSNLPNLFLESFKHHKGLRFIFPAISFFIIMITIHFSKKYYSDIYNVSYIIILFIILARFYLLKSVYNDFTGEVFADSARSSIETGFSELKASIKDNPWNFIKYGFNTYISLVALFFLTGELMKNIFKLYFDGGAIWIATLTITLCIYLARTAISTYLLPRLNKDSFNAISTTFTFTSLATGSCLFISNNISDVKIKIIILFISIVSSYMLVDTTTRQIEGGIRTYVKHEYLSSWISLANFSSYLLYGLTALILIFAPTNLNYPIVGFSFIAYFIFSLIESIKNKGSSKENFRNSFNKQILKGVYFLTLLIILIDIFSYSSVAINKHNESIQNVRRTIELGLKPSITQGNSIDAINFLHSIKSGNFIKCFRLKMGQTHYDNCIEENVKTDDFKEILINLIYDGSQFAEGSILIDNSILTKSILTRIAMDFTIAIIFYLSLLKLFEFIFGKFITEIEKLPSSLSDKNFKFSIEEFTTVQNELLKNLHTREELMKSEAKSNLAAQVSHDIQSPLVALKLSILDLKDIPSENRIIIENSIDRINDIAINLLTSFKTEEITASKSKIEPISLIIGSVVSEKRLTLREKSNIKINYDFNNSYGLYVDVSSSELKRVLSNLINNSADAISGDGFINIFVGPSSKSKILIEITDNGSGIPEEIIRKIGKEKISYGKKNIGSGFGLGLNHAFQAISEMNGDIQIFSDLGIGTKIQITLNCAHRPDWHVPFINTGINEFYILDDNEDFLKIWASKISQRNHLFSNPNDFIKKINERNDNNFVAFIDHDLNNFPQTGLEIIENLKIKSNSILVTSRFDSSILEKCETLKIGLIPKPLLPIIPIINTETVRNWYDYVLIENDKFLRLGWENRAKSKSINLLTLNFAEDFEIHENKISKDYTKIYIDIDLGKNKMNGIDFAIQLHNEGFKNIYISSGLDETHREEYPWLQFKGKSCPF
ncbi:MAG: sensor histidine kinase [Bacteriovoracaceae bacterium]